MRFKINEGYSLSSNFSGTSDYYRYFKYYFDFYLSASPDLEKLEDNIHLYIRNEEVERILSAFYSKQSFCRLLVGHTGVGKSTIIRNYFNINRTSPVLVNKNIIIPYYCNNQVCKLDPESFYNSAVLTVVEDLLLDKVNIRDTQTLHEDLWDFIKYNKPDVLRRSRHLIQITNRDSKIKDIKLLSENEKFAYSTFLLKYILSIAPDLVDNIIIILDDVESINNTELRSEYIKFAYHMFSCFKNKDGKYHVKLLIAERPCTRVEMHQQDWADQKNDINVWRSPSLTSLLQRRHDYVIEKLSPDALKRDSWDTSYQFLCLIINKIDRLAGEFILYLCNFNVRKALRVIEYCLAEGVWFQSSEHRASSFVIDRNTVSVYITEQLVVKAIAYGTRNIFFEREDFIHLPNIAKNQRHKYSDICGFLVIKWFYNKINIVDEFRISNNTEIDIFFNDLEFIFPAHYDLLSEHLEFVINHFIRKQVINKVIVENNREFVENFNLMPVAIALWESLHKSCVLLEIYRDDLWLESDAHIQENTRSLTHVQIAIEIINYCISIADIELEMFRVVTEQYQKDRYISSFGNDTVTNYLLYGVKKNIQARFVGDKYRRFTKSELDKIFCLLNSLEKKSRKLQEMLHE